MGQRYILDTSAIIDYIGNKLPEDSLSILDVIVNEGLNISIIVRIEVLGFDGDAAEMQQLRYFLDSANVYYLDNLVAEKTIQLRITNKKLKLPDAIIAATALVNDFTLVTRNTSDFDNIVGLQIVNPHEIILD